MILFVNAYPILSKIGETYPKPCGHSGHSITQSARGSAVIPHNAVNRGAGNLPFISYLVDVDGSGNPMQRCYRMSLPQNINEIHTMGLSRMQGTVNVSDLISIRDHIYKMWIF